MAVYFLLHFPWPRGRWALPITVSVGARTFLPPQVERPKSIDNRPAAIRSTPNPQSTVATIQAEHKRVATIPSRTKSAKELAVYVAACQALPCHESRRNISASTAFRTAGLSRHQAGPTK